MPVPVVPVAVLVLPMPVIVLPLAGVPVAPVTLEPAEVPVVAVLLLGALVFPWLVRWVHERVCSLPLEAPAVLEVPAGGVVVLPVLGVVWPGVVWPGVVCAGVVCAGVVGAGAVVAGACWASAVQPNERVAVINSVRLDFNIYSPHLYFCHPQTLLICA